MDLSTYGISIVTATIMLTVLLMIGKNSSSYNIVKAVVSVAFFSFILFPLIGEVKDFSNNIDYYLDLEYFEISDEVKDITEQNAVLKTKELISKALNDEGIDYFEIDVSVVTGNDNLIKLSDISIRVLNEQQKVQAKNIIDGIFLIDSNIYV